MHDRYFACALRLECKDHIGVYSTNPWSELHKFRPRTTDIAALEWTPHGTHLLAIDTHLQYRVLVYTPAGEVLCQYEPYSNALGVRSFAFYRNSAAPSPLLALGSYDNIVRLLSTRTWELAFELPLMHPAELLPVISNNVITTVEVTLDENAESSNVDESRDTVNVSMTSTLVAKYFCFHFCSL